VQLIFQFREAGQKVAQATGRFFPSFAVFPLATAPATWLNPYEVKVLVLGVCGNGFEEICFIGPKSLIMPAEFILPLLSHEPL
jgi:hypothetical protein